MEQEQLTPTENTNVVAPVTPAAPEPSAPVAKPQGELAPKPEAQPQQADPKDRRATLREQMIAKGVIKPANDSEQRILDRARDPRSGQFTKAAPQASPQPAQATQKAAPASAEVIPLPKSLKRELDAAWKAAHPELQKAFLQRDADYEKGISGAKARAEQAESLLAEFKPYEQVMRLTGATPATAIRNLMPTMAVLATGNPAEKAYVMARALQQYGIPLQHVAQVMQGGVQGVQGVQMSPEVAALAQQVNSLTQAFQTNQQRSEAAENARYAAMADSFGRDKPQFDSLRPQMWSLLQAQATAEEQGVPGPLGDSTATAGWSEQQWIENAYTAALRLNPAMYESELSRQREEAARAERDRATQEASRSRAASVQVRGAPSGATTAHQVDVRDRRSVIAAALRSRA